MTSITDLKTIAREALSRTEKATPGPWIIRLGATGYCRPVVLCKHGSILAELTSHDQVQEDATLMAHARTDVPALANAVLELCAREKDLCILMRRLIAHRKSDEIADAAREYLKSIGEWGIRLREEKA